MINPSWANYGTHSQSTHPHLWDQCIGAWYPGLGPTGNKVWDHSGLNRPLELINYNIATAWSNQGADYSVVGDGSNDYMYVPISGTSMLDLTVSFWFAPTTATGVGIWQWANATNAATPHLLLRGSGQTLIDGQYRVTLTLVANQWHHFAISRNHANTSGEWLVYLNGEQKLSYSDDGSPYHIANATGLYWGNGFPTFTDSRFDDMRLYDAALPDFYIKELASRRGIGYERRRRLKSLASVDDLSQTVNPNGLSSATSIGSPSVQVGDVTVSAVGIASTAAIGQPTVSAAQTIDASGIAATTAIGQPAVSVGDVTISATGIASTAAIGQPAIAAGDVTVSPDGVASTLAIGQPGVAPGSVSIAVSGVASTSALGQPAVTTGVVTVSTDGIASTVAFGSPTITSGAVIQLNGLSSASAIGSPAIQPGVVTVSVNGVASTVSIGQPVVDIGATVVGVNGIASTAAIGAPAITTGAVTVNASGIASGVAFGSPTVSPGPVTIAVDGLSDPTSFGNVAVTIGAITIAANGLLDSQDFGSVAITTGPVTITPSGFGGSSIGQPTVMVQISTVAGRTYVKGNINTPVLHGAIRSRPEVGSL